MSDGPFFPFDLFGCGIKAKLVTLSGCQTAAPGLNYGNTFSLAKAFNQAGSQYVLATLWSVSDSVTMTFMSELYGRLNETNDVVMSYYEAIKSLKNKVENPAFWGSFVLLGV